MVKFLSTPSVLAATLLLWPIGSSASQSLCDVVIRSVWCSEAAPGQFNLEPAEWLLESPTTLVEADEIELIVRGKILSTYNTAHDDVVGMTFSQPEESDVDWPGISLNYLRAGEGRIAPGAPTMRSERTNVSGMELPPKTEMRPVFPNPGRGEFSIPLLVSQEEEGHFELTVYDVRGRKASTLFDRHLEAGRHLLEWDGRDAEGRPVGAGIYFLRVTGPQGFLHSSKLVLLEP
jgi:hypothetical protein